MSALNAVLVTTTFYKSPDELRFSLACAMVQGALSVGYPVVIVDGSPNPMIAPAFKSMGAQVFPELHKGMGPSRRQAFFHANEYAQTQGIRAFVWTEPEKVGIANFVENLVEPIEMNQTEIVIARRSEETFKTWPEFQQESEKAANAVYNEAFGLQNFDPMFGVVAFDVSMMPYFALHREPVVDDTYIQHYAPIVARGKWGSKARITSVEIGLQYPRNQREEEEGTLNDAMLAKRATQMETLSKAYRLLAQKYPLKQPM